MLTRTPGDFGITLYNGYRAGVIEWGRSGNNMAATSTPSMTWEAFEQLPDGDGFHREILEGELQILPPVKSRHSRIQRKVFKALEPLDDRGLGEVYLEAGYKLSEDPATWIQPDASFLRSDRVHATAPDGYFIGGPDLAVEIVSPSESAKELERKIRLLLAAGGKAVWVVYPDPRTVYVYLPDGTSFTRGIGDKLSAPSIAADFELPVAQIFED